MKLISAIHTGWRFYRKHFWALMLTLLLELVLRAMALAPLLFLTVRETRFLALLSIPMYLLIVLPARQNVALSMQDMLSGGSPFSLRLVSFEDYGRKLLRGLTALLRLLVWCVPLIAGVIVALWATRGDVDGFTLIRAIRSVGGGNSMRGMGILVLVYLLTLVPPLLGCAFHGGARHAWALGNPALTKKRHGRLLGLGLVSLLAFVPFIAAAAIPCAGYIRSLMDALSTFLSTTELTIPRPGTMMIAIAVLFVVLALPAVPLRTLLPAVYMRGVQAEEQGAAGLIQNAS